MGRKGSNVSLSFSLLGCRGWVQTDGELPHLVANPGPGGDWSASYSRLIRERSLLRLGSVPRFYCGARRDFRTMANVPGAELQPPSESVSRGTQSLLCEVALEADMFLYAQFGDTEGPLVPLEPRALRQQGYASDTPITGSSAPRGSAPRSWSGTAPGPPVRGSRRDPAPLRSSR